MNDQLKQQFFDLYTVLDIQKRCIAAIEDHTFAIDALNSKHRQMKRKKYYILPRVLIPGGVLGVFALSTAMVQEFGFAMLFVIAAVVTILIVVPTFTQKNKKLQKQAEDFRAQADAEIAERQREIEELKALYQEFTSKYSYTFDFLPEQYHNIAAVVHMYHIVNAGRGDTLKEIINLYEQEVRWMEISKQISQQQKMMGQYMDEIYRQQMHANQILREIELNQILNM